MSGSEFSTNTSSAATDAAAGSPKRYAHGSEIGEALRAVIIANRDVAQKHEAIAEKYGQAIRRREWQSVLWAFDAVLRWADELNADAATAKQEEGIPTS